MKNKITFLSLLSYASSSMEYVVQLQNAYRGCLLNFSSVFKLKSYFCYFSFHSSVNGYAFFTYNGKTFLSSKVDAHIIAKLDLL